ncbi:MAG: hypothetical protein ACLQGP_02115 [Isosphaeraceae bacterium]
MSSLVQHRSSTPIASWNQTWRTTGFLLAAALGGLPSSPARAQDNQVYSAVRVQATPLRIENVSGAGGNEAPHNTGTAVLVQRGKPEDYYLVTAYHVVERSRNIDFLFGNDIFAWGSDDLMAKSYVSLAKDLAIFKLTKDGYKKCRDSIPGVSRPHVVKAVQLLDTRQFGGDESALGRTAVAVGNPEIQINVSDESEPWKLENVVYGGTVSELPTVESRLRQIVRKTGEKQSREMALNTQLLFLETLSITRGFSGGPVFVTTRPTANADPASPPQEQRLAGIIMGGSPRTDAFSGRYAFASPASNIERGILILEEALSPPANPTKLRTDESILEYNPDVSSISWPMAIYNYGTTHGFAGSQLVEKVRLRNDAMSGYRAVTDSAEKERISYTFLEVTFDEVHFYNLTDGDLSNYQFIKCTFIKPDFDGVVMNGTVFQSPRFISEHQPDDKLGCLYDYGIPQMAYGVRIRDAKWRAREVQGTAQTPKPAQEAQGNAQAPKPAQGNAQAPKPAQAYPDDIGIFSNKPVAPPVAVPSPAGTPEEGGIPLNVRRFWNYFDVHRKN